MARNYYLSELDFRNLTTVKGISIDQISQISNQPFYNKKIIREKVDEKSLENIARAICSIDNIAPYQNFYENQYALKVKRLKNRSISEIVEYFKNSKGNNSEVFKMHLVLKRLSPNHTIKACTLDLVKENNLLSFISSIEQADIIELVQN